MHLNIIQNMRFKTNYFEQKIRIFLQVLIILMNTIYLQLYWTAYKLQLIIWIILYYILMSYSEVFLSGYFV